jgi:tripartite-type tricarboxylate transporter receptor subunit TctC
MVIRLSEETLTMRRETISAATCFFWIAALCGSLISPAFGQEKFFEGKTIRIVVGFSAGGGFDAYSRAIGRHMGKHIAGAPSILVENMGGAGSMIVANHVYNQAKPDGLTIGNWMAGLSFSKLSARKESLSMRRSLNGSALLYVSIMPAFLRARAESPVWTSGWNPKFW